MRFLLLWRPSLRPVIHHSRHVSPSIKHPQSLFVARHIASTSSIASTSQPNPASPDPMPPTNKETSPLSTPPSTPAPIRTTSTTPTPTAPSPQPISRSTLELLPLLRSQPSHYISILLHGKRYLLTPGDIIRLPFLMGGVTPGDVLRLNVADYIGSRDFTLKGAPYVDERLFECRARVMGVDSEPMRTKVKRKQRNRKRKTVKSKHRYTVLRVMELRVKDPAEVVD